MAFCFVQSVTFLAQSHFPLSGQKCEGHSFLKYNKDMPREVKVEHLNPKILSPCSGLMCKNSQQPVLIS